MKARIRNLSLCAAVACACSLVLSAPAYSKGPRFKLPPRNVIMIIGDGMDSQQITAARNYLVGAQGQLNIDRLPKRSSAQVLTVSESDPDKAVYVGDSASGGTALATGVYTSIGRISTTAGTDTDLPTILELAKAAGYRAGVVTTAAVTDATPAAFLAHVKSRICEGPTDMNPATVPFPTAGCPADKKSNGGKGSIAEQIATGRADVVLGGGKTKFGQTIEEGGKTVLQLAQERGFQYVDTPSALNAATGPRVLGLFTNSTMPVKLIGDAAAAAVLVAGDPTKIPAAGNCISNPAFNPVTVPSLADMTDKAVELLSKNNPKGFFLMVESASVDKEAHSRNACGHIGEMEQLDEVVEMVRDYASDHPGTLIVVTSDHGHAVQVLNEAEPEFVSSTPTAPMGYVTQINTPSDGSVLRIGYATNGPGGREDHTGTEVPVLVGGGVPSFSLKQFMQQIDVVPMMAKHLGLYVD